MKKVFWSEAAYFVGLIILSLGTALMAKADFGLSMVVAPAYLLHLKLSAIFPAFSFGMAEYVFQALLLLLLSLAMRRFKRSYLFSFVTAVLYGLILDMWIALIAALPSDTMLLRGAFYVLGMLFCAIGVAFFLKTYIAPEAYELVVKEIVAKYRFRVEKVKTLYDCASCIISIILSFAFFGFGHFEGIKLGTVVCALLNGWLIGCISRFLDRHLRFKDALPLAKLFAR